MRVVTVIDIQKALQTLVDDHAANKKMLQLNRD
jgi:hypothetical protein